MSGWLGCLVVGLVVDLFACWLCGWWFRLVGFVGFVGWLVVWCLFLVGWWIGWYFSHIPYYLFVSRI